MSDSFDDGGLGDRFKRGKRRFGSSRGSISDLIKHVQILYSSSGLFYSLWIQPSDKRTTVTLLKFFDRDITASVIVRQYSEQEKVVFGFLSERGLEIPKDSPFPETFLPNLPVDLICKIKPMPPDPPKLAQLISDLFRQLGETEETLFRYIWQETSGV